MARRTRRIRPDMTPLIDCVFLLLVFFLVTSVFKQDESVLKLILPETYERIAVVLDILQVEKLYNIQLINELEGGE